MNVILCNNSSIVFQLWIVGIPNKNKIYYTSTPESVITISMTDSWLKIA